MSRFQGREAGERRDVSPPVFGVGSSASGMATAGEEQMTRKKKAVGRTRIDVHRAFQARARDVFHFLIAEYGFHEVVPASDTDGSIVREVRVQFVKDQVGVLIHCEGIFQNISLQGDITGGGWSEFALSLLMKRRCPDVPVPAYIDSEDEAGLRQILETYADILRTHFRDFLEGDPSVMSPPPFPYGLPGEGPREP